MFRVAMFLLCLVVTTRSAIGTPLIYRQHTRTIDLTCGGTRFTATTYIVGGYVTKQEMWARRPGMTGSRRIDLRQSTFTLHGDLDFPGLPIVADEVGFWGCATTPKGHVLMLWYDCPQALPDDVPRRFCSESGEWYRYVATDGSLLDKGFGLGAGLGDSDPRERGLRIRIGLPPDEEHVTFLPLPWPLP